MFLHLGGGRAVSTKEICAILSKETLDNPENSHILDKWIAEGRLVKAEEPPEEIKTLIVTKTKIYQSILAPLTLVRRTKQYID